MSYDSWLNCNDDYRRHVASVARKTEETENESNEETTNDGKVCNYQISLQGSGVFATADNRSGPAEVEKIN